MNHHSEAGLPQFMVPGWSGFIGEHTFLAEEIVEFAKAYDPQPFHIDAQAARASLFGSLCASGWHTASMWMRKQRDYTQKYLAERAKNGLPAAEFGPSPGFENLKWPKPVYAGDTIRYFNQTTACRKSRSRPGWHIMSARSSGKNQHDELVLTFESAVMLKYPV
ncbi:MaoC family dehydratase [Salaquimonas pukyongi]|uniref:MaoC family dehydratase n=1 Tax=Salaquimonas pukyongi TaxID=2712698 RepID=UPI001FCDF83D|nr:MaoC family dehydratase [Salaquimonas pukyongi]